jgi:hypothetical protein
MRIQWGSPPATPAPVVEMQNGRPIRQPGRWASAILASLAGILVLAIPVAVLFGFSFLHQGLKSTSSGNMDAGAWIAVVLAFFLCIATHELLHAALYPDSGRSDSTVLFVAWRKLQFGVYYEGFISRTRWLVMRLFPILGLTILPMIVWLAAYDGLTNAGEAFLMVLVITNSLGSGGDMVAALIVLLQVPASGTLNFYRGKGVLDTGKSYVRAAASPGDFNTRISRKIIP